MRLFILLLIFFVSCCFGACWPGYNSNMKTKTHSRIRSNHRKHLMDFVRDVSRAVLEHVEVAELCGAGFSLVGLPGCQVSEAEACMPPRRTALIFVS